MSVLDDIRSHADAAHAFLEDAETSVRQASEEASALEESASGHGWSGVAAAMSDAQETLSAVSASIESAREATSQGLEQLGGITEEMSSDEVARRLGDVGGVLEPAGSTADQAVEQLGDARGFAEQADAETLMRLVDGAEEDLRKSRESLEAAVKDTRSDQGEASSWGN
jgi:hypothetical protein